MRSVTRLAATTLLLGCSSAVLALGVRVDDCAALRAEAGLLDRHPELTAACDSVVRLDGRRYLRMNAEFRQRHEELLVLRLRGSTEDMALSPGSADLVAAGAASGGLSAAMPVGSPLSVYFREDDVLEVFADTGTLADARVPVIVESDAAREARIANYTCCPRRRPWYPVVELLPMTAAPLPLMGLLGAGLLVTAAAIRLRRLTRR
jgi:hypothetical protein